MYPRRFAYCRARDLEQALQVLAEDGEETKVLAGGQSLIPLLKLRLASPRRLLDIARLAALRKIRIAGDSVLIGALACHADLERFPMPKTLRIFGEAAGSIADRQVRNVGTVGGALAQADPAGDWGAVLLALESAALCKSARGERRIALKDFFLDAYTTALRPEEILTEIAVALPGSGTGSAYVKFERKAGDFAVAGAAVMVRAGKRRKIEAIGIGLTGVGLTPIKAVNAESVLRSRELSPELLANAADALMGETDPLSDLRGSPEYKREVAGAIFKRAFHTAWQRAESREQL
jgi:carbon-monoxide dehydrogenase medium subunit